jgi:hypothetical protein
MAMLPAIVVAAAAGMILRRGGGAGIRDATLQAVVVAGLWLVAGTELLSAAGALRPWAIGLWWAVPAAVGTALVVRDTRRWGRPPRLPSAAPWEWLVLLAVVALALLSLVSAALAPAGNYDSLTYHLPRTVFWLQQGSVDHYSTSNLRQLIMPPLAEYAVAHLVALTGSDRLVGLVQWIAAMATLVATSLVTRRLGGGAVVQWLACAFVLASPLVFMQASSTKNDLVVGMWLAIAAWWALRWWDEAPTPWSALQLGAAAGACALTKGTGMLFVVPVAAAAAAAALRWRTRRAAALAVVAALVALAVTAPFVARNVRQFGRPLGPDRASGGYDLVNERPGLDVLASNAARTAAQEAALPSDACNALLTRAVTHLHERALGMSVNDPTTTTPYSRFTGVAFLPSNEDLAASPVHVLLLLLVPLALLLAPPGSFPLRPWLLVVGMGIGAFALMCLVLKWQAWNVRFVASLAGLVAPAVAVALASRWRAAVVLFATAALLVAAYPSVRRSPRRVFSKTSVLRRDVADPRFALAGSREDLLSAADVVVARRAAVVGLALADDTPDYLFIQTLASRVPWELTFEYVNPRVFVRGTPHAVADVVIALAGTDALRDVATATGYRLERSYSRFALLVPEDAELPRGVAGDPVGAGGE